MMILLNLFMLYHHKIVQQQIIDITLDNDNTLLSAPDSLVALDCFTVSLRGGFVDTSRFVPYRRKPDSQSWSM